MSVTIFAGCTGSISEKGVESVFPELTGKYMGQQEPGLKPELFAPNIVSTGMSEINAVFSPDYKEFYYSIRMPSGQLVIMVMNYYEEKWSEPQVASFSGEYPDADPFFSADGNCLYFISRRPVDSTLAEKEDWDIWRIQRDGDIWLEPERLDSGINSNLNETYPSLTKSGKLYFSSERLVRNKKDIYCAEATDDGFSSPIRLSDTINSHWEGDIFISPDEDYMIFSSYGREAGSGLYISFCEEKQWSLPQRMSEEINMTGREFCPIVSPDGNYFLFTSNHSITPESDSEKLSYSKIKEDFANSFKHPQRGKTDIYWVSTKIIEDYRSENH